MRYSTTLVVAFAAHALALPVPIAAFEEVSGAQAEPAVIALHWYGGSAGDKRDVVMDSGGW